MWELSL